MEKQNKKEEASSIQTQTIRKKMDKKENKIQDLKDLKATFMEKKESSHNKIVDIVCKDKEREIFDKGWKKNNNDSLKEEIDERLKSIERSIIYTHHQNDSLTELTKKIEILNAPLDIDRKKDITVLNTTKSSDNEKNERHTRNTIYHKCKEYGHTKKQCDRHNKNVKHISELELEKDIINELMEIFNVKQKELDQVKKKKELKSTNPLKVNKRTRKQKDIIMTDEGIKINM